MFVLVYKLDIQQAKAGRSGVQVLLGLHSEFQDFLGSMWRKTLTRDFFLLQASVFLFVKWGTILSVAFFKRCCKAKSIPKLPHM